MPNTNRRSLLKSLAGAAVAAPAAASSGLRDQAAAVLSGGQWKPAPVTQAELQQAIDFYNASEVAAANILRRLRAGAEMERGRLGVSTVIQAPLEYYEQHGGIGQADHLETCGISIQPVERKWVERDLAIMREVGAPGEFVLA